VAFSKGASARITLGSVVLLIISSMGVTGLSSWKETATDFPAGQNLNTHIENGSLALDMNQSLLGNWTKVEDLSSPSPRNSPSIVYDSSNGVGVLFGGLAGTSCFNDTWTYDASANRWERKYPTVSPSPRTNAVMCYDRTEGCVVLFGGWYNSTLLGDTWTYSVPSNTWTNRQPPVSPPASASNCMAYDPDSHLVLLFGVDFGVNATWTYNMSGNLWVNRTCGMAPPARFGAGLVYDEVGRLAVLFGGEADYTVFGDTWVYHTSTFTWAQRSPPSSPSAGYGHAVAYDSSLGVMLLLGGFVSDLGAPLGDTWAYNSIPDTWTNLTSATSPGPREGAGMFYDSNMNTAVLFGGYDGAYNRGDSWLYSPQGHYASGNYTSAPMDTGGRAYFGNLQWESVAPASTSVKLQFRTGATLADMESKSFTGPDGTSDTFFTASDRMNLSIYNDSRWTQYRAYLLTDNIFLTPSLKSVMIQYNLLQNITLSSPSGGDNWTGIQNIAWSAYDNDNDSLSFDIYLENGSSVTPLVSGLANDNKQWSWNTNATPNGTYRIRIAAIDDNPFIPLTIIATSNNFTIHHPGPPPPPNHLPHVTLISPPNNSFLRTNAVRFQWQASDPDGDPLTYTVHYSDQPLSQGTNISNITSSDHLDLSNLSDNKTYYWTVDASDGKANGTDIPAEIWSFTVRLPPANIPVRFTSIPPTIAWVGKEYVYNLTSIDEDGDIPSFSIISGPANMILNSSTGKFRWTPSTFDIGNHTISVRVADGRGSTDNQTFTITVKDVPIPPVFPPKCAITYPANGTKVNGIIKVLGTASNGSLPLSIVKIRIDNGTRTSAVGLESWTFSLNTLKLAKGQHHIEASAFDANLSSETASVNFTVNNPSPGVSLGGDTWCLPAIILVAMAGIGSLVYIWKKRGLR
jgi:hypothetical protein